MYAACSPIAYARVMCRVSTLTKTKLSWNIICCVFITCKTHTIVAALYGIGPISLTQFLSISNSSFCKNFSSKSFCSFLNLLIHWNFQALECFPGCCGSGKANVFGVYAILYYCNIHRLQLVLQIVFIYSWYVC